MASRITTTIIYVITRTPAVAENEPIVQHCLE